MDIDRRQFFRRAFAKTGEVVVKQLDEKVTKRAAHYIRPPYALPEIEFLLSCTRCDACTEACPHDVIFLLSDRLGADVKGTPALDLTNRACLLCEGFPCVSACEPGALTKAGDSAPPRMATVMINEETCLPYQGPECGICVSICPVPGAIELKLDKPLISQTQCVGCAQCRVACIVEPSAISIRSLHSTV